MKNYSILFLLCCLTFIQFFFIGCNTGNNGDKTKWPSQDTSKKKVGFILGKNQMFKDDQELSIDRANELVKAYKDDVTTGKPIFIDERTLKPVTAFSIDRSTIDKIAKEFPTYTGIRVYFAIRNRTTGGDPIYTLVVVPRGEKYEEGKYKNILKDNFLFDWIEPCPDNCPDPDTELGN